jgi:hypothetical protein
VFQVAVTCNITCQVLSVEGTVNVPDGLLFPLHEDCPNRGANPRKVGGGFDEQVAIWLAVLPLMDTERFHPVTQTFPLCGVTMKPGEIREETVPVVPPNSPEPVPDQVSVRVQGAFVPEYDKIAFPYSWRPSPPLVDVPPSAPLVPPLQLLAMGVLFGALNVNVLDGSAWATPTATSASGATRNAFRVRNDLACSR